MDATRRGSQADQWAARVLRVDSVLNPRGRQAAQVFGQGYSRGEDTRIVHMARHIVSIM